MSLIIPRLFEDKKELRNLSEGEAFGVEFFSDQNQRQYSVTTTSHVLVFILKGQKIVHLQDRDLVLEADSLLFIQKGSYLFSDTGGDDSEYQRLMLFLEDSFITDFVQRISLPKENIPKPEEIFSLSVSPLLKNVLHSLKSYLKEDFTYSDELLRIKLQEILLHILENDSDNKFVSFLRHLITRKKSNIEEVINEHFTTPLTIAEFAKLSNRSTKQFTRDFQKMYQTNPKEWITHKRLEHARHLVQQSGKSMTEISSESGFDNYSHFIQLFKKRYNITPKQMQLQNQ